MTPEQNKLIRFVRDTGEGNTVSEQTMNLFAVRKSESRMIPTRNGDTPVYIHYPTADQNVYPLFINIHGGGFIKGHRQQDTVFSKNICNHTNAVVIDLDYMTSPEQRYPYALHQCYDVVKWASDNHESLNIDPTAIVLCGHSAGGNLVAAITLLNGLKKNFDIAFQILDYPCLDLYTPPQIKPNAYKNPMKISPEIAKLYQSAYVNDVPALDPAVYARVVNLFNTSYIDDDRRLEPTASPLFAPDEMLKGLPEALVFTCGDDVFGDEGEKYAYRLLQAGVPVTARRFLNSSHGFLVRRQEQFEEAEAMIYMAIEKMKKNF